MAIETVEQLNELFLENEPTTIVVRENDGTISILAEDEDGNVFRTRPPHEDDRDPGQHVDWVLIDTVAWPLEPIARNGEPWDGHHTMDEMYEYRMLYMAHAAQGWLNAGEMVVKSWHHSDGEPCFGGGWFVVYALLPSGQVSNHYKAEYWDLFTVPEVENAPAYDGHTPDDAARRLARDLKYWGQR